MATKTATKKPKNPYVGKGSAGNNIGDRKDKTRKTEQCQWCHAKVPLKDQYVVYNDWDAEETLMVKGAQKPEHAKRSHYCKECATKRQKTKQRGDFRLAAERREAAGKRKPKKAAKKAAKKTAKPKATKKAAKPAGKKQTVKKASAKKSAAKAAGDPFAK